MSRTITSGSWLSGAGCLLLFLSLSDHALAQNEPQAELPDLASVSQQPLPSSPSPPPPSGPATTTPADTASSEEAPASSPDATAVSGSQQRPPIVAPQTPPVAVPQTQPELKPPKPKEIDQALHPHRAQRDKYLWGTFGPPGLIEAALSAGFQQWREVPPEWGKDTLGYIKRYGAVYGGGAIGDTTKFLVARMLDEDPSFRPCRCTGVFRRLRHAMLGPFLARKPDGHTVFSLARLAGMATKNTIASTTWEPTNHGARGIAKDVGVSVASTMGVDLLREFILHRRNAPPD